MRAELLTSPPNLRPIAQFAKTMEELLTCPPTLCSNKPYNDPLADVFASLWEPDPWEALILQDDDSTSQPPAPVANTESHDDPPVHLVPSTSPLHSNSAQHIIAQVYRRHKARQAHAAQLALTMAEILHCPPTLRPNQPLISVTPEALPILDVPDTWEELTNSDEDCSSSPNTDTTTDPDDDIQCHFHT
ncbi:hypothetical protein SEMRO_2170_G317440.1 [Seminavis robusta]|uniref:Uncharacterized protein n=1 Tax=Seminavis robusta TaxID=568900 RepID=A0A9N8EZ18_9STRA|nr:hypothetical protein SEMRO_2170_G317440.1 [Seminavis robusta]|eukprot:Sro2170_g317440.1 n/a (189) ;mRNA; f:15525-16091